MKNDGVVTRNLTHDDGDSGRVDKMMMTTKKNYQGISLSVSLPYDVIIMTFIAAVLPPAGKTP